jgi:hypothetical protein
MPSDIQVKYFRGDTEVPATQLSLLDVIEAQGQVNDTLASIRRKTKMASRSAPVDIGKYRSVPLHGTGGKPRPTQDKAPFKTA